jgi:hypothetical protein
MSTSVPPPEPHGEPPAPSAASAGTAPSRRPPAKLLASGLGVVVLVVLALVIFGSSSNNAVDPIAVAATQSSNSPGFRMLLSMRIGSDALPAAVTGQGSGSFSTHARTGSMTLTVGVPTGGATRSIRISEILDGPTVYMQLPSSLMSGLGSVGKRWIAVNLAKVSGIPALSSLESNPASSNPSEMLQYLKAASGSVSNEGHQVVDGFSTTRYHANIEISKIADAVPASERAAAQQAMAQLQKLAKIGQIPVTVWVDAHHLVRQMTMTITATASGQTINEAFTIEIPQYGPQPPPTIPPASEVANVG